MTPLLTFLLVALVSPLRADTLSDALARTRQKDYAGARALLVKELRAHPANALAWFDLGSASFNLGDFGNAALAFHKVISLKSPLAPAAALSLAKCRRRQKNWDAALHALEDPILKDENLVDAVASEHQQLAEALRREAVQSLDAGDSEQALTLFDLSLKADDRGDSMYGRGLALVALSRYDEAREAFRRYLSAPGVTPYASDARYFLYRLESGIGRGAVWLNMEAGAGYNTNVFTTGDSAGPISKPEALVALNGGWQLTGRERFSARVGYTGFLNEIIGEKLGRFVSQQVQGELGYHDADWTLLLMPQVAFQWLSTDPYRLQAGAEVDVTRSWRTVGLGFRYQGLRDYPQASYYSYLNGDEHWAELHLDFLGRYLELQLLYDGYYDNIDDIVTGTFVLPLYGIAHGPGMKLYWSPFPGWESTFSLSYLFRSYDSHAQPGDVERKDRQWLGSARISHRLSRSFSVFVSLDFVKNASTLGASNPTIDRNYTQFLGLTGVSWNVLN